MVDMIQSPFMWGTDGKPRSPAQVAQQRKVAEALLAQAPQGKGWASALGQAVQGLGSKVNSTQADIYETEGREAAGSLFSGIAPGSSTEQIAAALSNPASAWATPVQTGVAEALMSQNLQQSDPAYQLDLAYKQAQIDKMQMDAANGGLGDESFFGTAVPMQDAEGNLVLGQMSNQGRWQPLQGAEGYSPAPTTKQIDTGTEIITTDVYGNELYRTPKENRAAAYETGFGGVEGKTDAENVALAESVQSKMPGLRTVIDELTALADTATYTQSGQIMDSVKREFGLEVGQGAIDRASYIAIVDNQVLPLLKDTFGAAFTVAEGQSLRATLGDPNKSPQEKKAILDAFIQQKERDVAAMQRKAPGGAVDQGANAPAIGTGGYTVLGVE